MRQGITNGIMPQFFKSKTPESLVGYHFQVRRKRDILNAILDLIGPPLTETVRISRYRLRGVALKQKLECCLEDYQSP